MRFFFSHPHNNMRQYSSSSFFFGTSLFRKDGWETMLCSPSLHPFPNWYPLNRCIDFKSYGRVRTDILKSLSSTVHLFTSPYVSQSRGSPTLSFPVQIFPIPFAPQSLCSPPSLFPSHDIPHKWFSVPGCSPKTFPSPDVLVGAT